MDREAGDKKVQVRAEDVTNALCEVGVVKGDTVMFHSSLSSMGHVVGGADAVIAGFLDAVGPTGTVAVPTLCNWTPEEQHLVFERWDPATTPSFVGAITEGFRRRPDAIRSDNATHSVAAIGARAEQLTARHGMGGLRQGPFGPKAFAVESPWERFRQWDVAYCFLGVTFQVNTMVHYVESLLVERAILRAPEDKREHLESRIARWMQPGIWPTIRIEDREVIEGILAEMAIVRYALIGAATLRCACAKRMVDEWIRTVEADPARWLPDDYLQWLEETEA
jgi:aminoglycoside 3-N-acetyltransferase